MRQYGGCPAWIDLFQLKAQSQHVFHAALQSADGTAVLDVTALELLDHFGVGNHFIQQRIVAAEHFVQRLVVAFVGDMNRTDEIDPVATLARNLRKFRGDKGLSLDDVAEKANISKAYLWELERDTAGTKKPSAAVLMRIAGALSKTLAELLELPTIQAPTGVVEVPSSLEELRKRLAGMGQLLTDNDRSSSDSTTNA